jgi:hypothetical protein
MTWAGTAAVAAVGSVGSSIIGGIMGAKSSRQAAQMQSDAATRASQQQLEASKYASDQSLTASREANQLLRDQYNQTRQDYQPYMQAGTTSLSALTGAMGLGGGGPYAGQLQKTFAPSDLTTDPSYQFRLEQGLQALKASKNATGSLQTGQGLKDITNYAQGAASQEYQSAYDRFMNNQNTLYNRLSGIAGLGQNALGTVSGQGQAAAGAAGSNITGAAGQAGGYMTGGAARAGEYGTSAAAARAAGTVGSTNAMTSGFTGGLNQGLNNWMSLQYLNKIQPGVGTRPAVSPNSQSIE